MEINTNRKETHRFLFYAEINNRQIIMTTMTPMCVAKALAENPLAVEILKRDESVASELLPSALSFHQPVLDLPIIPAHCHGRNHIPLLNEESIRVMTDAISAALQFSATSDLDLDKMEEEISRKVGRTVLRSKKAAFGGKILVQLQIHLKKPVYSQRLRIPIELADKVVFRRRHVTAGAAPGVDFFAPLDDTTRPYLVKVQSLVLTVCVSSGNSVDVGLGTVYTGTHFPGESVDNVEQTTPSGQGVFFKWYPSDADRAVDATKYAESLPLSTHLDVLLEPVDYQTLIMQPLIS
jgi:hypothetical protein